MAQGAGKNRRETIRAVTDYSAATLELGVAVAVGVGIGYWLDSVFHTGPWLTLLWLLFGVFAGFRSLYRVVRRLEEREAEADKDRDEH
ncbi:MAG: AtpZ/AtpI family protein [Deltaproteobacteria bacterium]|nr:AtpZ/AtpI family protein [Deltaproteobacteria bacterium]